MKHFHLLHRVEATAITMATGGALSGLKGIDPLGIPLDRFGMYADIIAGAFALGHWIHHKRQHGAEHESEGA